MFVVVCSVAAARCGDYIVYTSQLLRHRLFYLPLLFVCLRFVPPYEEKVVYYTCKVVARASAWPLVGVYFSDMLRFLILGGFTSCTFICVLSCGLNVSHFSRFLFFFFDSACSSAALYVLCLCVSAWGEGRPFICDCLCLRLYITPLLRCLSAVHPPSFWFFSVCCLSSLLVRVSACVCASVCERRETETEGALGVWRAPGNALFTMSVSGRHICDARPQMFQSMSNKVRCHRKC